MLPQPFCALERESDLRINGLTNQHWTRQQDFLSTLLDQPRCGLISDFDGTLSAYVGDPATAVIAPENGVLLDVLSQKLTVVALVSGREVRNLRLRFEHPALIYYGSHGMEYWQDDQVHVIGGARQWAEPLQHLLAEFGDPAIAGVFVEPKTVTASVHYRLAENPTETRDVLYARLLPLCKKYGFVLSTGQFIWEIKPPVAIDKGSAAQSVIEAYRLESVIFLGDDVTDFAAMDRLATLAADPKRSLMALSIGVVHPTSSAELFEHCNLTANGIEDVTHLLRWMTEYLNSAPSAPR